MIKKRKFFSVIMHPITLVGMFFLFSSVILSAQNNKPKGLTLNDCIALAIQNNYLLQSDSILSQSLQMMVKQEQAAYHPQISGSAGSSGFFLSPYSFGQHYLQAIADWDLGRFWHKTADIQQKQLEHQEALTKQNKLEITGIITGLYLDVLQNQLEIKILQARLDYLKQHIDILNVLWKAGTARQLDILQTQSSLNKVKEEMMQKELIAKQAKYALARLMGLDSPEQFSMKPLNKDLPSLAEVNQVPEIWLERHPQIQVFQKEYEKELLISTF